MANDSSAVSYRFDRFMLQPRERRLLADDSDVPLGPRAFDVLVLLVESAGHLVNKETLLNAVWPRVVVEENALQAQVSAIRKVLGREAIVTVSGRGYRFVPTVETEPADDPARPSPRPTPRRLPQPLTSFVGREKELVELSQLMRQARLVTLTGSGGCGKTRLAIQLAAGVESMFPDGLWFVELAGLTEPGLVPQALATALELQGSSARPLTQVIASYLASRRALIVLDNTEHLLDACALLADDILKQCARTSVLVTSRESLGITGELTYPVPSLSLPSAAAEYAPDGVMHFESVRLFAARARLQRPHFELTPQNATAVASLCRRLDGVPLAIELAAARMRAMAPEEIDRRLDRRFLLLTDGSRTALPRHRTLQSLIDWSYDLLEVHEKALFCRLAVFSGGWTLEAAEGVCATTVSDQHEMLDVLTSLVDKSLVATLEINGGTRYRLLETMRQYGLDRLREKEEEALWRSRHLDHMVVLARQAEKGLQSSEQSTWLERFDLEHDNLRAALSWAIDGGSIDVGLRLAGYAFYFWWMRGYVHEARELLRQLLTSSRETSDIPARAKALAAAGQFAMVQSDYVAAFDHQENALALYRQLGNRSAVATMLSGIAVALDEQGSFDRARALFQEALTLHRELGVPESIAAVLNRMGWSARNHGRLDEAKTLLEESVAVFRSLGDVSRTAHTLLILAGVALDRNELDIAEEYGRESLATYRGLNERRGRASALLHLGLVARATARWEIANASLKESLVDFGELDDQSGVAQALDGLALVHAFTAPLEAGRIWGAVEHLRQAAGLKLTEALQSAHDGHVKAARRALCDDEAFDRTWREGARMGLRELTQFVLHGPRPG